MFSKGPICLATRLPTAGLAPNDTHCCSPAPGETELQPRKHRRIRKTFGDDVGEIDQERTVSDIR